MMETNYDEDISENPFFLRLQKDYSSIFKKAIDERWIICVPRHGSFQDVDLVQNDILKHILQPDKFENDSFYTLNGIKVQVKNKVLRMENSVADSYLGARLLFEETVYTKDKRKYCIWCIEHPLDHRTLSLPRNNNLSTVTNVRECMNLIWTDVLDKSLLRDLNNNIEGFISAHSNLEHEPLPKQKDLVYALYQTGLEIILKDLKIQEKIVSNTFFVKNLKVAVETYILYGLQNILSRSLSASVASDDASLNKILRNLQEVQLSDLGIRRDLEDNIPTSKLELSRLSSLPTVLGKIECLKRTVRHLSEGVESISSDNLLPVLIFLVIKISLPNWMMQLSFLKHFRFSANSACEADQAGFLIASFEAAIKHVALGKIPKPLSFRLDKSDQHMQLLQAQKQVPLSYLFDCIQRGDLSEVDRVLSKVEGDNQKPNNEFSFCHPLCTCESCEANRDCTSSWPTVHTKDDRGTTSLHVASSAGHITVVDFLLNHGADVNETDADGMTALHYASMNGHQATILLLLYANANPSTSDTRGNTPLHFASDRGHEGCVKALLYFAEQTRIPFDINSTNANGDVPLHYASKWGYCGIVEILLEYGANIGALNKRGQTPLTLAQNPNISESLKKPTTYHTSQRSFFTLPMTKTKNKISEHQIKQGGSQKTKKSDNRLTSDKNKFKIQKNKSLEKDQEIIGGNSITSGCQSAIDPKNKKNKEQHAKQRLFSAIMAGDVCLASYYLGLDNSMSPVRLRKNNCHPLCDCQRCCLSNDELKDDQEKSKQYSRSSMLNDVMTITVSNENGEHALHVAAAAGVTEIVRILLNAGANVNVLTKSAGRTPLHIACSSNHIDIAKLLLNFPTCDINAKDYNNGDTPLHLAITIGNTKIVQLLITYGANVRLSNFLGVTPLALLKTKSNVPEFAALVKILEKC